MHLAKESQSNENLKMKSSGSKASNGQRRKILDQAKSLFLDDGYAGFSTRKVARKMSISQGHLQHYFPCKEDLVTAMLTEFSDDYIVNYDKITSLPSAEDETRIDKLIKYLVMDSDRSEMVRFFTEFWSISTRNEWASDRLKAMYQRNVDEIAKVLSSALSELPDTKLRALALRIVVFVDGLIVHLHSMRPDTEQAQATKDAAISTLQNLVEDFVRR